MLLSKILLVVAGFVSASFADLVCYHCEDCALQKATLQLCGLDDDRSPVETIPATITTTSFPWPTIILTTADADGDDGSVISRHPSDRPDTSTTVSGRPGSDRPNSEEPLLTPPTAPGTIYPRRGFEAVTPAGGEEVRQSYACLTQKSVENGREVIRRGCVRVGLQKDGSCRSETSGSLQNCEVCTSHLCNNKI